MKELKKWYTYKRDGIISVQFKDKVTGKKLTAKSTGTRDARKAAEIINQWYYDADSFFNKNQKYSSMKLLKKIFQESNFSGSELLGIAKESFATIINNSEISFNPKTKNYPEIQQIIDNSQSLKFADYLLKFWTYDESPYIKEFEKVGKKPPNPERFKSKLSSLKKYYGVLGNKLLLEINADEINLIFGLIKKRGKIKESSLAAIRSSIVQALRFAYKNNIITKDLTKELETFSNKSEEKEIFNTDELKTIFNPDKNIFENEKYALINELLFITGCRIGEIQALQIKDVKILKGKKFLKINKSWSRHGRRLKGTKTGRSDLVPISNNTADKILRFIETNPFKNDNEAFIFYSKTKNQPIGYNAIAKNFYTTMGKLDIKRDNLTLHSYRHTYATLLQDAGYSDSDLLYLTRHDDLEILKRYHNHNTFAKNQKKIEAVDIIEKIIS